MGILNWLTRGKEVEGPAKVGMQGKPVYAGAPRRPNKRRARNEKRIARLRSALERDPGNESVQAELARREAAQGGK